MSRQLGGKGLALISPFEGFSHCAVVVLNKSQDLSFQFLGGSKVALFDHLTNQDTEPDFYLVHSGSMLRRVMKDNAVCWIAQEFSARGFGFENATFAFHA